LDTVLAREDNHEKSRQSIDKISYKSVAMPMKNDRKTIMYWSYEGKSPENVRFYLGLA
jgi:hypothetical protein